MQRIRDLYVVHIVLLIVCVGGLAISARAFQNPLYFEHVNLTPFNHDPAGAIWRALILLYQPGYLNILPLYMLLLMWFPFLLWLMQRHLALALAVSVLVWMVPTFLQWNLPSYPDSYGWIFNPFAWQLLFSLGAISAALASRGNLPSRSSLLLGVAAAYLLFALVVAAPWTRLPGLADARLLPDFRPDISKQNLSLWRIAHIAALAYIASSLVPRNANWLAHASARRVVDCGRHSLPVFSLATVLAMAGFVIMVEAGRGFLPHIIVNTTCLALMGFTAWKLAQVKRAGTAAKSAPKAVASSGWSPLWRRSL